jgi:SAM-dependent methyltransferase
MLEENHPLKGDYKVVSCNGCGFVYSKTSVAKKEYDAYYRSMSIYADSKTNTGAGENPCDKKRLFQSAECINSYLNNTQSKIDSRILDVGCANGGLLHSLRTMGYKNLCGIDPSAVCIRNLKKLGIEGYIGSATYYPKSIGQFDLIILSHVMEHICNVREALRSLSKLLKPHGSIYIEVSNASEYMNYISAPFQDFNTEHINHFSVRSMSNLMGQSGFYIQKSGTKIFESSPGNPYPALYGFWSKIDKKKIDFKIIKDTSLRSRIKTYISRSKDMMTAIDTRIQSALKKNPEIIVWGTGQLLTKLLTDTCLSHAHIVAFVDGNTLHVGKKIKNIEIQLPEKIIDLKQPILIATLLHQEAIANRIRNDLKMPNEIIFLGTKTWIP